MSNPWLKFYPSDWRSDPALRMCSLSARGLWMEMLCVMHEADPCGSLVINGRALTARQIASLSGSTLVEVEAAISELEEAGVFGREPDGTIYSRRMRRDVEKAERDAKRGNSGGNPEIRRGTVPKEQRVRPFRRSDAPEKTQRIFDSDNGACHWCSTGLVWDWDRKEPTPANLFHVDHVVAVCDGGTNDEGNLVASCARCNHDRAREPHPTLTRNAPVVNLGVSVGIDPDIKAQKPEARSQKLDIPPSPSITAAKEGGGDGLVDLWEKFERGFPWGKLMSRGKAFDLFVRLPADDQQSAVAALPEFVASAKTAKLSNPIAAATYIERRLFANFAVQSTGPPLVFVPVDTPAWLERVRAGHRPGIRTQHVVAGHSVEGWHFPASTTPKNGLQ